MNLKLYVGNLAYSVTEEQLREQFAQAGEVKSVSIPMDRMTGQPRGFAFVEMADETAAVKAIRFCNGVELAGRTLRVNEAKPPEARTGGGERGGFGGGNRGGDRGDRGGFRGGDRRGGDRRSF